MKDLEIIINDKIESLEDKIDIWLSDLDSGFTNEKLANDMIDQYSYQKMILKDVLDEYKEGK